MGNLRRPVQPVAPAKFARDRTAQINGFRANREGIEAGQRRNAEIERRVASRLRAGRDDVRPSNMLLALRVILFCNFSAARKAPLRFVEFAECSTVGPRLTGLMPDSKLKYSLDRYFYFS